MIVPSFQRLAQSKFRAGFRLKGKDLEYALAKDAAVLRRHAFDFIRKRLAPENPFKDGKQTPFRGHPVFVAQHATATCCRSCLKKWYCIPRNRALNETEIERIADVLISWIDRQCSASLKRI
ncbi:MAG: DUF4186 domain-containing protein [Candidatus Omnitrophica bacterium]|nr:DUF4186 domain-containing protein [Candidatus Omnitrophota bacterium]